METQRRERLNKAVKASQRREWDSNHAPCTRPLAPCWPEAATLGNRQCEVPVPWQAGNGKMVEATAWMSLISFCYSPVRTEQKERLKDGKGVALLKRELGIRAAGAMCLWPWPWLLCCVMQEARVLEGSHRNVIEMEKIPQPVSPLGAECLICYLDKILVLPWPRAHQQDVCVCGRPLSAEQKW